MASFRVCVILDIGIGKILPRMMVLCLVLIGERRIKAAFIQGSDTQIQVVDITAALSIYARKRQQADSEEQNNLSHILTSLLFLKQYGIKGIRTQHIFIVNGDTDGTTTDLLL